jgi:peptidyl-prolyl cis-trans isomerase SurA
VDAGRFRDRAEARRFAEQLVAQARAGADFRKLAVQHDMGDSRYRNGEGYGSRRGEIQPPEVEQRLFQMKDGDLGVLEVANGLHVFKLVKRDYAGVLPLDDKLQTTIRGKLRNDVWEREYKRIVARLRQQATIEVLEDGP